MTKTLVYEARDPERDMAAIEFFFRHLSDFLRYKDAILKSGVGFLPIFGAGATGLYMGDEPALLGDLVQLYDDGGAWKIQKGDELIYLIHIGGSPLSGSNHCFGWNARAKKTETFSLDRFSDGYVPLRRLHQRENAPNADFAENTDIPAELNDLCAQLARYADDFYKKLKGKDPYPNKPFAFKEEKRPPKNKAKSGRAK